MIGSFFAGQMSTRLEWMECWWEINTASAIIRVRLIVVVVVVNFIIVIEFWSIANRAAIFANANKKFFEIEISKTFTFNEKRTSINVITFQIKLTLWTDVIPTKAPPKNHVTVVAQVVSSFVCICFIWQEKLIVYKRWLPFVQLIN